ncbi:MAG TPA: hypothetical protein VND94_14240 [Terriglobia bacterium]|nr:hypothetical protein [Terriglobia bacterium]
MGWSKAAAEAGSDETALMSALQRLDRHRQNRWGLELRLSSLRSYHKRPQHIRAVRKLLTPLRQRFEASIFQLASGDLFILMQCPNIAEAKPVLLNILNLFVDDPLVAGKDEAEALDALSPIFDLETGYEAARAHVTGLIEQNRGLRAETVAEPAARAPMHVVSPQQITEIERAIKNANLANLLRRQSACVVAPGLPPSPVFHELFFSTTDLAQLITPGYDLTSNKWLFQHLTSLFDQRMLSLLMDRAYRGTLRNASMNLTLKTILTPEFLDFDTETNVKDRGSLAIELPFVEVTGEPGEFFFAQKLLHGLGYKIILDCVRHEALPLIDRELLGVDMVKVIWETGLEDHADGSWGEKLRAAIQRIGRERVCFCRVDAPEAIDTGRKLGVSLFQGRLIDAMVQDRKPASAAG